MKTGKIKILISALLVFILVFSLVGCTNKNESQPTEPKEDLEIVDAEMYDLPNCNIYFWNKSNVEIDGKTYFDYLIEVNVDEYYSYPTKDLVYIINSEDGNFEKIENVIKDVKIETYCPNKDLGGSTEYFIRIRSPKLLDTKKINVLYIGVKNFDANIDLDSYVDSQTNREDLYSAMVCLTEPDSKVVTYRPFKNVNKLGEDFIVTESESLFYYFGSSEKMFIKDNTLWQKIDIDPVNHGDLNELAENLEYLGFAKFNKDAKSNNDVESIYFDEKYVTKSKVEDGNVYIGFTTEDNSAIDESFRPDALVLLRDAKFDTDKITNFDDCKELCTYFKINYGE